MHVKPASLASVHLQCRDLHFDILVDWLEYSGYEIRIRTWRFISKYLSNLATGHRRSLENSAMILMTIAVEHRVNAIGNEVPNVIFHHGD